jgi:streptogramin lyase
VRVFGGDNPTDRASNRLLATVAVPGEPRAGLATGFGSLWIPLCGDSPGLAKVDLASNKLVAVFKVAVVEEGSVTTSRDSVWLVVDKSGSLARIDPRSGAVRAIVHVPPGSYNPRYSDGQIWVTRADGAEVTAVDARTGAILATAASGPNPRFLTAGSGAIWTLNQRDGSLTRIDARSRKATNTIALGTPGHGGDIGFGGGTVSRIGLKAALSQCKDTAH